jgi:hypothetical protein
MTLSGPFPHESSAHGTSAQTLGDPPAQTPSNLSIVQQEFRRSVTELTGGVASYVARLPMPAVDATAWAKTLDQDISPPLAIPAEPSTKSLNDNDNS